MVRLGYAVDLGTTTIDVCLVDLDKSERIASLSRKNPQSLYGSDVINRILNASRSKEIKDRMKSLVMDALLDMLRQMLSSAEEGGYKTSSFETISSVVISGNTTMVSILLGYDIEGLGRAPFSTILKQNVKLSAKEFFENEKFNCDVILTGCAGAFIGGDILAGIVWLDKEESAPFLGDKNAMLIDLGTNGEIVLNAGGRLYGTSTACGPAFEGCVRRQGVYGATVIDAICLALRARKLSNDGVLTDEYLKDGININGVRLDMDIIRDILMAKAAIYSGISCIIRHAGLESDNIDTVYLAGGFGFYLNIENAVEIGLIPAEFKGKIKVCGNSSLSGAVLMLADSGYAEKVDGLTKDMIHPVQLADDAGYKDMLIENMTFRR